MRESVTSSSWRLPWCRPINVCCGHRRGDRRTVEIRWRPVPPSACCCSHSLIPSALSPFYLPPLSPSLSPLTSLSLSFPLSLRPSLSIPILFPLSVLPSFTFPFLSLFPSVSLLHIPLSITLFLSLSPSPFSPLPSPFHLPLSSPLSPPLSLSPSPPLPPSSPLHFCSDVEQLGTLFEWKEACVCVCVCVCVCWWGRECVRGVDGEGRVGG